MDTNFIAVISLLFTLLSIPLPSVFVDNLYDFITGATTVLGGINYAQDLVINPNPILPLLGILPVPVYDFIIVGAGSAGCVIANRLSAQNFKVLVLEAGGDPLVLNGIPALASYNTNKPETDWRYVSVPQINSSYSYVNNSIPTPRGKSVGGSSNLNIMVYMRGNPNDFNNWANITGDNQWNYEHVLPYFIKSENYIGNYPNPTYHGTGGYLTVSKQSYQLMVEQWVAAGQQVGFNPSDPNANQTSTFTPMDVTIKNGVRASTYKAFIEPVLHRNNLKIIRYAHVTKINFNSSKSAVGVTYKRDGKSFTVKASKEVILSAGAIGSPQLLMLSGIGPSAHLSSIGVHPILKDSPVGIGLKDHVETFWGPFILNDSVSLIPERDITYQDAIDYSYNGSGVLSSNLLGGIGLFSTEDELNPSWPNQCTFQTPLGVYESFGKNFGQFFGLKDGILDTYFQGFEGRDANFVFLQLARPKSVGSIQLQSTNAFDHPLIDFKYYSHPDDMKHMIRGMRFIQNFFENTTAFNAYNATLIPNRFPGCENFTIRTDGYYECYLRHFTATTWHLCATNRMGASGDPNAVVDSHLRVFGVHNLRVADASVMPEITNANINAPTIMIGEKAADLILEDWM